MVSDGDQGHSGNIRYSQLFQTAYCFWGRRAEEVTSATKSAVNDTELFEQMTIFIDTLFCSRTQAVTVLRIAAWHWHKFQPEILKYSG